MKFLICLLFSTTQASLNVPTGMSPNVSLTSLNLSINASADSLTLHSPQLQRAAPSPVQVPVRVNGEGKVAGYD